MAARKDQADCARDFRGLYQRASGHPLMLKLLGRISCARLWSTAEVIRRLDESRPGSPGTGLDMQSLRETLAALYPMAHLPELHRRLMRLICCLGVAALCPGRDG